MAPASSADDMHSVGERSRDPSHSPADAFDDFVAWLAKRATVKARIGSIWPRPSSFFKNILQLENSHVSQESFGYWIELQLVGDYVPHESTLRKDTVRGYHGASMYSLPLIAIAGMLQSRAMVSGEGYPQTLGVSYMLAEGIQGATHSWCTPRCRTAAGCTHRWSS